MVQMEFRENKVVMAGVYYLRCQLHQVDLPFNLTPLVLINMMSRGGMQSNLWMRSSKEGRKEGKGKEKLVKNAISRGMTSS